MRRGSIAAIFVALCVIISLRGGVDVEDQAFALSMGLDGLEDGNLGVTLVIPSAQAEKGESSGGSGGGSSSDSIGGSYQLVNVSAASYEDALLLLQATIPRDLNFSQLLQVVVSERLAREATFSNLLRSVLATPRLQQSAVLAVSLGTAEDFLTNQKPFLGIRLSANIETGIGIYEKRGNIPMTMLGEARRAMEGGWSTPLLPLVSVSRAQGEGRAQPGDPLRTVAGNIPYRGGHLSEYLGAAVLSGGRMVGTLTGSEMELLSFLLGGMKEFIFFHEGTYYRLERHGQARMSARRQGEGWVLSVNGRVDAYPASDEPVDGQALQDAFSQALLSTLERLRGMGADPAGFAGLSARGASTLEAWRALDWPAAYQEAALEVSVSVRMAQKQ